MLTAKARDAYLYAGFADVTVETVPGEDGDRLEMTIVEGRRYLAGEVVVQGARTIDADLLVQDLTVEPPAVYGSVAKSGRTLWPLGKTVWLNHSAIGWLREEVEDRLLERGVVGAQFTLEIVPDRERAVATLAINFADGGVPAVVNEISVSGNKKNSAEDVLAFLGLRTGMRFLGELDTLAQRKLGESGRFIKSKVKVLKPASPSEPLKLAIDLVEYEKAPSLKQELSRQEAALVKLGGWFNRFHDSDEEAIVKDEEAGDVIEAVVASRRGALVFFRAAEDKKSGIPFTLAFVLSDERIGFYSTAAKRKMEGIPTPGRVRGNVEITFHDGPPKVTGYGKLTVGIGLRSSPKPHDHCVVRFGDTAVSMLSLAHEYGSKLSWNHDALTVTYCERQLTLDAAAGNLVEERSWIDGSAFTISRTSGEFERRLKEIEVAAADYRPDPQADRPLAAAIELYCDTALSYLTGKDHVEDRKYLAVLRKLAALGALAPLDRMVIAACRAPEEEFFIPDDRSDAAFWTDDDQADWPAIKFAGGRYGIKYADFLAGRGSWPWETWREAMFVLAGKSRHLEQELVKHLSSPESGPIRHLIVGELLRLNDMQAMARVFGLAGQSHLTAEDFRHDYSAMLDADTFIGGYLLTLADVIRQLDEGEIKTLADALVADDWLDRGQARVFAELAKRLRGDRNVPIMNALPIALDAWWRLGLHDYIENELQSLVRYPNTGISEAERLASQSNWRYRWHHGRWWYYTQRGAWQYWTGNRWAAYPAPMANRPRLRRR